MGNYFTQILLNMCVLLVLLRSLKVPANFIGDPIIRTHLDMLPLLGTAIFRLSIKQAFTLAEQNYFLSSWTIPNKSMFPRSRGKHYCR